MVSLVDWRRPSPDEVWNGLETKARPPASHQLVARLLIYPGDVCRLPRSIDAVCVSSGLAWITHAGRDLIVGSGETARLVHGRDFALVSALGQSPLTLAVYATALKAPNVDLTGE